MLLFFFLGAVSEVSSQGICGSCYAYAVTGAVEAAHYIKVTSIFIYCFWLDISRVTEICIQTSASFVYGIFTQCSLSSSSEPLSNEGPVFSCETPIIHQCNAHVIHQSGVCLPFLKKPLRLCLHWRILEYAGNWKILIGGTRILETKHYWLFMENLY